MIKMSLKGFSRIQVIGGITLLLVIFAQVFARKIKKPEIQTIVVGSALLPDFTTKKEKQHIPVLYLEDSSSGYNEMIADFARQDSLDWISNPIVEQNIITFKSGDNLCKTLGIDYYEAMSLINRNRFEIKNDSINNRQIPIIPIGTEFVLIKRKNGEKIIYQNTPETYCLITEEELDK